MRKNQKEPETKGEGVRCSKDYVKIRHMYSRTSTGLLHVIGEALKASYEGGGVWAGPGRTSNWHMVRRGSAGSRSNMKKKHEIVKRYEVLGNNS